MTPTGLIIAETEMRADPPTSSKGCEWIDSDNPEQEIDIVGLETDEETVHNIITNYAKNLDKKSKSQPQTNPCQAYTTDDTSLL